MTKVSKAKRRAQLLEVMYARHEQARKQADFCADMVAAEAGVSRVYFYLLVGKEFRDLRGRLPGKRRPSRDVIATLHREIKELRAQLFELRLRYESSIKEKIAEAIRHIELLDEENKMLRDRVAMLEQRLDEGTVSIQPNAIPFPTSTRPQNADLRLEP